MQEEAKRDDRPAEPSFVLMIPGRDGRHRVVTLARRRAWALAAACVAVVGLLAGTAGSLGWQYFHSPVDRAGYEGPDKARRNF